MEKVKISKELANNIELNNGADPVLLVKRHFDNLFTVGEDAGTLIKALFIGYEVEETPEDIFRAFIKTIPSTHLETAIKVIDIFNIKIEGIN